MQKSKTRKVLLGIFLWTILAIMYMPLLLLLVFSFHEGRAISFEEFNFGLEMWRRFFDDSGALLAIFNTFFIATIAAIIATLIGTIACVGILNMRSRGRNITMNVNQLPFINADIITSFSLLLLFVAIGMANAGYMRLILAHTLICLPIVVLTVLPRMRQLDKDMYDAAVDLGAKPLHALFGVIIPQVFPAMVGGFLLGFTLSLDDFIITQYNNSKVQTISTLVYNATKQGVPPHFRALSAFIFCLVLLVLIIYNIRTKKAKPKSHK